MSYCNFLEASSDKTGDMQMDAEKALSTAAGLLRAFGLLQSNKSKYMKKVLYADG